MNTLTKLLVRGKLLSFILIIILSCSLALGSVGIASVTGVKKQINEIDKNYTTVATFNGGQDFLDMLFDMAYGKDRDGESIFEKDDKLKSLVINEECRSYFDAYTPKCVSVTPYETKNYGSYVYNGLNNNLAVVAVECEQVESILNERTIFASNSGEEYDQPRVVKQKQYEATFKLEKIVCCSDGHKTFEDKAIDGIKLYNGDICNEDGSIPFTVGKKYIMFASFSSNHGIWNLSGMYSLPEPFYLCMMNGEFDGIVNRRTVEGEDGNYYNVVTEESMPFCSEYEGDIDGYLKSEEGKVWVEKVIPYCEMNYRSAAVIALDNIETMYSFNVGIASVMEGRIFNGKEYSEGRKVCMVSSSYADKNGLDVGDSIQMDIYDGDLREEVIEYNYDSEDEGKLVGFGQRALIPEHYLNITDKWEIVGIYTAPECAEGCYNFSANTIFVPKKSIANASEYERVYPALFYTIVLKNGTEKQFAKEVSKYSGGERFLYSNQGHDVVNESLVVMMKTAKRLCFVCCVGAILSLLLVIFVYWKRIAGTTLKMRLLGVSHKKVLQQSIGSMLPVIGISGIMGMGLGELLCKVAIKIFIKTEIPIQLSYIMISIVAQMVIVLCVVTVTMVFMARTRLINRKHD